MNRKLILIATIVGTLALANAHAQTPPQTADTVKTRIGDLKFEQGFPTEETKRKVFDEIDYQRAVQAYMWAYPAVSFEAFRVGFKRDLGVDYNDVGVADNFSGPEGLVLTANDTTIYAVVNVDLAKSGPIVLELPPGPIVGMIEDFWQRSSIDVGLPGPDGGKGGKFLILPVGYKGEVPQSGYFIVHGTMNNYNIMVRGIIPSFDQKEMGVANIKRVKVYPFSERANPKPNKFTSFSGKKINTLPPMGMAYWEMLSAFINNNPIEARDVFYMGMLKPLGIEKGKPFKPDARQRTILEEAARIGDAASRVMLFEGDERFKKGLPFAGAHWQWVFQSNAVQLTDTHGQVDERLHYTYGAIYTSPALGLMKPGPGGNYVQVFKDKDGKHLDGGKSYHLNVPAKAPAAAFWSITVYDTETRSQVQAAMNDAARSSLDKLQTNADGSIDLYFGPKSPAGKEANWVQTLPGKGWYPMFRFYTPTAGLFDGSWKLPDIEVVSSEKK